MDDLVLAAGNFVCLSLNRSACAQRQARLDRNRCTGRKAIVPPDGRLAIVVCTMVHSVGFAGSKPTVVVLYSSSLAVFGTLAPADPILDLAESLV